MARITEDVITRNDEGYNHYGSAIVSVRDTETGEVRTASVDYCPSKSPSEAIAEAIQEANSKF